MRLLEPMLSEHRAMQAMGHELLRDDSVHCACFDCQPHAVRHQPGGMLGDINAAA
ncbi:hypothetical protein LH427_04155 [Laribacter hongkongensis]|uniref:hypothetical protein n=1 Tax=Laribacter hongkongensis TaxID=168471 RepID=UPI001EFD0B7F|nr:hypothetical protein [Laribacter hongkongensis]MCG8991712.1 hypothetical protein [Laribacter hongkongensis]MCG9000310.1 hypothetical protein [Laribacter hongkongensis]MCG9004856.1 hypothetical protein [Laribacter hongkongensis]MCG9006702.1 hypothetical protein [Laribacter hongkongensis]MCG9013792.1 hypothetical protein [Laribacter hongkongensis]